MQVATSQVALWSIGGGLAEESREIGSAADPVDYKRRVHNNWAITIARSYHMNYQTYVWQETSYGNELMGTVFL